MINDLLQTLPVELLPDTSSLREVSDAFAHAVPLALTQTWFAQPDERFRPAMVRTGWTSTAFVVFAELEDDSIYSDATGLNDQTWEKGDVFEIFLRNPASMEYQEFHIAPNGAKLQLRIPSLDEFVDRGKRHAAMGNFELTGGAIRSRIWIEGRRWVTLTQIPFTELQLPANPVGSDLKFSFSRYDYTRGTPEPVLSSTSPHREVNFHRQEDWSRLVICNR